MPPVGQGLRLALVASLLVGVATCQGPDAYYRNRPDGGALGLGGTGGAGASPFAGKSGIGGATGTAGLGGAGVAGTAGLAGIAGAAGNGATAGAAGTGGGSGAAGTGGGSGAAGTGAAGNGTTSGAAGANMPCTTCMVKVQYTCRSVDTGQASFVLDVTNESSVAFPLSSLTLRYWYTIDAAKADAQELDCDFAKLGCTNLVTSADTNPAPKFKQVMPPRPMANEYAELAFKAGALSLDPFLDTGEIQLRLHNKDFSPIQQNDDFSFDMVECQGMQGNAVEWPNITAYLDGVLVWGTEPQP